LNESRRIVLTAAIVGLGIAVMASVSNGLQDLSGDIENQLTAQGINTTFTTTGG